MALGRQQRAVLDRLEAEWRERAAPSIVPATFGAIEADLPSRLYPELDCVRAELPNDVIAAAERRSASVGVGADRVLICDRTLDEEAYLRALAASLDLSFETLDDVPRQACPIDDERLLEAAAAGLLPLRCDGEAVLVVAPRGVAARRIVGLIETRPALARRFRLTSPERLHRFVFRHGGRALGERAAQALHAAWPALSAAPPRWRHSIAPAAVFGIFALAALLIAPSQAAAAFEIMLAVVFLAWMILRIAGTLVECPASAKPVRIRDDELPVYTIMAALYREAAAVEGLIAALGRIDYPPEKLDIKLIVETDDRETQAALARLALGPPFEVIVAPAAGPRTKPKALNVALPFARGSFVVIYDAEDRPEPEQLHRALDAFLSQDDDLACVQACLTIDNTADNWMTALFTAEYAGQFDVFLPALAALRLPLPLGGSSNHFRTAVLRAVGAWDPYNVTEDADLGLRLARFGYRSSVIAPTTYEEAPARFGPWLRQRTRWFKGWMQT